MINRFLSNNYNIVIFVTSLMRLCGSALSPSPNRIYVETRSRFEEASPENWTDSPWQMLHPRSI